ncbi:MAG: hypothetical protein K0U54_06100 [Bacteroidetes bacterium]|nr:hypothetical protein [Bacteroidota bacterium]
MKIFTYILIAIGLGLLIFNSTKINLKAPFSGDSAIAAIGIMAAACAILLAIILQISHKIKEKKKTRK